HSGADERSEAPVADLEVAAEDPLRGAGSRHEAGVPARPVGRGDQEQREHADSTSRPALRPQRRMTDAMRCVDRAAIILTLERGGEHAPACFPEVPVVAEARLL